jgi:hypothetical protein
MQHYSISNSTIHKMCRQYINELFITNEVFCTVIPITSINVHAHNNDVHSCDQDRLLYYLK